MGNKIDQFDDEKFHGIVLQFCNQWLSIANEDVRQLASRVPEVDWERFLSHLCYISANVIMVFVHKIRERKNTYLIPMIKAGPNMFLSGFSWSYLVLHVHQVLNNSFWSWMILSDTKWSYLLLNDPICSKYSYLILNDSVSSLLILLGPEWSNLILNDPFLS